MHDWPRLYYKVSPWVERSRSQSTFEIISRLGKHPVFVFVYLFVFVFVFCFVLSFAERCMVANLGANDKSRAFTRHGGTKGQGTVFSNE